MIYSAELLDLISPLSGQSWEGVVFRHMFGSTEPERENTTGARWNPADLGTIYTSLEAATAKAEGQYHVDSQPFRPTAERRLHRVQVRLASVLNLTDWNLLCQLQVVQDSYDAPEPPRCKEVGGTVAFLGHDGFIAPSARAANGLNLIIYPDNQTPTYEFTPLDFTVVG